MVKLRERKNFWSFRSRVVSILMACTLVASAVAMVFSYGISRYNLRGELSADEAELAETMLQMESSTPLTVQDILRLSSSDKLYVSLLLDASILSASARQVLARQGYVTLQGSFGTLPVTCVQLKDTTYCIQPSARYNLFVSLSMRVITVCLTFAAIFLLMVAIVSSRISRPVTRLTQATRAVAAQDFDVRLPENEGGEVGELMKSFNQMAESLGHTAWLQKDFIANLSHEFRTPIAAISGYAAMLKLPGLTDAQREEFVDVIAAESDRLSRLSNTLLRLSALEQKATSAEISSVRVDEQIRQVILRLEPIWNEKRIDWDLSLPAVRADTDADLLMQVWTNLLQNAVKFSPKGGVIRAALEENRGELHFVLKDAGSGMDSETLKHIFERFYQADSSRATEGTGIGLYLVQRILSILGGHIDAISQPGEGSTFMVELPVSPQNGTP